MIAYLFIGACTVWTTYYSVRLLWIARNKGYVMALDDPFRDAAETPQSREKKPAKFWANVICAVAMLPLGIFGIWLSLAGLWSAMKHPVG